jgi:hypothetical protein
MVLFLTLSAVAGFARHASADLERPPTGLEIAWAAESAPPDLTKTCITRLTNGAVLCFTPSAGLDTWDIDPANGVIVGRLEVQQRDGANRIAPVVGAAAQLPAGIYIVCVAVVGGQWHSYFVSDDRLVLDSAEVLCTPRAPGDPESPVRFIPWEDVVPNAVGNPVADPNGFHFEGTLNVRISISIQRFHFSFALRGRIAVDVP